MKKIIFCVPIIAFLYACALEGANVTGPAGGFVFYDKGYYSDGWRYLEASPKDAGEAEWGKTRNYNTNADIETSALIGKGKDNTDLLIAKFKTINVTGTAAHLCEEFTYGGYSDWFLPSENELKQMMETAGNSFEDSEYYWSSTGDGYYATVVYQYNSGEPYTSIYNYSENSYKVRPARRF